ncbi:hypothetical protein EV183_000841 [Coemansia sp. RSA 2336]|nr:hypothetical protein EV183_000841 [Coemansia sp. RSA 2336]
MVALGAATIGFTGYSMFFGPGNLYPKSVRKLLREGGMAYLRPKDKQDLPKAIECYTKALAKLDELGSNDSKHAPDAPHITGLVARIASVYGEMGDLDMVIKMYKDLLQRILGDRGMEDPKTQVRKLLDDKLPKSERENIMRALGCANKLAEAYESRGERAERRSIALPNMKKASNADSQEASRWYQWCLQVVMLTYQNHFNHLQLDQGKPVTSTPSFDPETLPRYFSVDVVTSLLYNAATFFASHSQLDLAEPLLERALDLMRRGADGKQESVCRSSVVMSHLVNANVMKKNLAAAEKWSIEGLQLAKKFPENAECLNSFVALAYGLGAVYEAAGKYNSARVQYRQASEIAGDMGDDLAAKLTRDALSRISKAA